MLRCALRGIPPKNAAPPVLGLRPLSSAWRRNAKHAGHERWRVNALRGAPGRAYSSRGERPTRSATSHSQQQIVACDRESEVCRGGFADQTAGHPLPARPRTTKPNRTASTCDVRAHLYRLTGVDLTRIDGIDAPTALKVVAETGLDMRRWPSDKHFASWLTLAPGTKVSGGKTISGHTKPSASRAAAALRLAARSLHHSKSALGAFFRRLKARLGAPKVITATAHTLARLIYRILKGGTDYVDQGQEYYERRYQTRASSPPFRAARTRPATPSSRRPDHAPRRAKPDALSYLEGGIPFVATSPPPFRETQRIIGGSGAGRPRRPRQPTSSWCRW